MRSALSASRGDTNTPHASPASASAPAALAAPAAASAAEYETGWAAASPKLRLQVSSLGPGGGSDPKSSPQPGIVMSNASSNQVLDERLMPPRCPRKASITA